MRKNLVALVMVLMMITTLWNPIKPIDNIDDDPIIIMAVEDGPGGAW
ncbi:hypothetical protein [Vallitalea okinawensis]|nr:hypothetical protein [Vallitalea okinawensis]